ncbi:MAG: SMP-30/gluconolactonase/LRE family protein [Rhodanobacteraceae bacterium]
MDDVEIIDPRFRKCVVPNTGLEKLGDGFRLLEGPVWFADQDCLLFSDIPNNRVMRWTESGGVSLFRAPSDFENGHTRDRQGRLISCVHRARSMRRTELDGTLTQLADRFQGKQLNSPNDVVVKSDGSIWFSDPPYGIQMDYQGGKHESELPANYYRLDPDSGELTVAIGDFEGPNGLCFSPDEKRLYAVEFGLLFANSPTQCVRVFDVADDGRTLGNCRDFCKVPCGAADGMRCDADGNLWSSGGDGVYCFAPDGTLLGRIKTGCVVSNLCFGGRNRSRLFICASQILYAIYLNVRGAERL